MNKSISIFFRYHLIIQTKLTTTTTTITTTTTTDIIIISDNFTLFVLLI